MLAESDPFGWYSDEKSVEIPIFESLPSPPYHVELKSAPLPANAVYVVADSAIDAGDYREQPNLAAYRLPSPAFATPDLYDSVPSSPLLYAPPLPARLLYESSPPMEPAPSPPAVNHAGGGGGDDVATVKIEGEPRGSNAEWLKRETLTPPDSPKEAEEILRMLERMEPAALERLVVAGDAEFASLAEAAAAQAEAPDIVDEKPRLCASPVAYSDDSAAASPAAASDDPEWTPPSGVVAPRYASRSAGRRSGVKSVGAERRPKPYSKSGGAAEERRQRKKEQNKSAATRYRLKKKAEVEEVKLEEHQLAEYNAKLREQLDEVCREVRYLKSLMREVFRKQGLIG